LDYCQDEYWLPEDEHEFIDGPERRSTLERRGGNFKAITDVVGSDGTSWILELIFLAYPVWRTLMRYDAEGVSAGRISDNYYIYNERACTDEDGDLEPLEIIPVPTYEDATTPGFIFPWGTDWNAAQVEHVIDRQIMLEFFRDITLGVLRTEGEVNLEAIPGEMLRSRRPDDGDNVEAGEFHHTYPGLGKEPALNPGGAQSDEPIRRIMEPFGTTRNPLPLLYCDPMINGAKGRIMRGKHSSDLAVVRKDAKTAATTGTEHAYNTLMHHFRLANTTWRYMGGEEYGKQFNIVRQGVHSQLGLVERHTDIPDLVAWWEVWSPDYFL
jgi:hypothetical protein